MKAKDIRKGTVIIYKDVPHRVLDFHHHTPGNLRALVQAKLRNVLNGIQTDTRFSSTEELQQADIYSHDATYLYHDVNGYHFMDSQSYEEVVLDDAMVGDGKFYLIDGMTAEISIYNGQPIGISLPQTVTLTIVETEPALKGATVSNSGKPATTDTGLTLSVPPFVKIGDKILVNTEEGKYLSRAD